MIKDKKRFYNYMSEVEPVVPMDILGLAYYQEEQYFTHNYTNLATAAPGTILVGDVGLNDMTANGHNGIPVGSPFTRNITKYKGAVTRSLSDVAGRCVRLNTPGAAFFSTSFSVDAVIYSAAAWGANDFDICGGFDATSGVEIKVRRSDRLIQVSYNGVGWRTTQAVPNSTDQIWGMTLIEVDVVLGTEIKIYCNGAPIPAVQVAGNIAAPGAFTNATQNFHIGSSNRNGVLAQNTAQSSLLFFSAGPIPSAVNRRYKRAYIFKNVFSWEDEITVTNAAQVTDMQHELVADVFNIPNWAAGAYVIGNKVYHAATKRNYIANANTNQEPPHANWTLVENLLDAMPAIAPTVTMGYTGNLHGHATGGGPITTAQLNNFSSWDRYVFVMQDPGGNNWTSIVYFGHGDGAPSTGELRVVCQGHNSESASNLASVLDVHGGLGHDVMFVALCIAGANTTANPAITLASTSGHDQIVSTGLEATFLKSSLQLYFFEKASMFNYLGSTYPVIKYHGLSAGGWNTTFAAALFPNISASVACRGTKLLSIGDNGWLNEGDSEQLGSQFTSNRCGARLWALGKKYTYANLHLLATSGGRKHLILGNEYDVSVKGMEPYTCFGPKLREVSQSFGGDLQVDIDPNPAFAAHEYSSYDIAAILSFFGD
jgi:hypothetical protein